MQPTIPVTRNSDDWLEIAPTGTGTADAVPSDDKRNPRAVLWVPDIEQWHGWREYYVYSVDEKPGRRMGFRP